MAAIKESDESKRRAEEEAWKIARRAATIFAESLSGGGGSIEGSVKAAQDILHQARKVAGA